MQIETVTAATFELVLPLVAAYQRFYEAVPDAQRNRAHFAQFLDDHTHGLQFIALSEAGQALGFATIYFPLHSVTPGVGCLMNDLFVVPEARGSGCGQALIRHCLEYARAHGYRELEWQTAPTNLTAQRLYDGVGGTRTTWYTYTLPVNSEGGRDVRA